MTRWLQYLGVCACLLTLLTLCLLLAYGVSAAGDSLSAVLDSMRS